MKGSHYLVISYFRAPRLPLRSRATGERARQTEAEGKKRGRGPRPITGPVRVTGDRERGREERVRKKKDGASLQSSPFSLFLVLSLSSSF